MLAEDVRKRQDVLNNLIKNMSMKMYGDGNADVISALPILGEIYLNECRS